MEDYLNDKNHLSLFILTKIRPINSCRKKLDDEINKWQNYRTDIIHFDKYNIF